MLTTWRCVRPLAYGDLTFNLPAMYGRGLAPDFAQAASVWQHGINGSVREAFSCLIEPQHVPTVGRNVGPAFTENPK